MATAMIAMMGTGRAFAQDDSTQKDHKTNVTYTVAESYEWSVPTKIDFTTNRTVTTSGKSGETQNVYVSKNVIAATNKLHITLATSNTFQIASTEGAILDYTVKVGDSEIALSDSNNTVLDVDAGINTKEATLKFELKKDDVEKAGTYTGYVTYEASVVSQNQ